MEQSKINELRQSLNKYLEEQGCKAKFIANKIEISETSICRFRSGELNLTKSYLDKLNNFLEQNKKGA